MRRLASAVTCERVGSQRLDATIHRPKQSRRHGGSDGKGRVGSMAARAVPPPAHHRTFGRFVCSHGRPWWHAPELVGRCGRGNGMKAKQRQSRANGNTEGTSRIKSGRANTRTSRPSTTSVRRLPAAASPSGGFAIVASPIHHVLTWRRRPGTSSTSSSAAASRRSVPNPPLSSLRMDSIRFDSLPAPARPIDHQFTTTIS